MSKVIYNNLIYVEISKYRAKVGTGDGRPNGINDTSIINQETEKYVADIDIININKCSMLIVTAERSVFNALHTAFLPCGIVVVCKVETPQIASKIWMKQSFFYISRKKNF